MEYEMEVTRTVRPTIAARNIYITRSSAYGPSQTSSSRTIERSSRSSYGPSSGALALMTKSGAGGFADVRSTRDKEKREMQVSCDINKNYHKIKYVRYNNQVFLFSV